MSENEIPMPDSNEPVINELDNKDALAQQASEEIQEWLSENGLNEKAFTVSVKKTPLDGGFPAYMSYVEKNKIPDREFLGREYGPGKYTIGFTYWTPSVQTGKPKRSVKDFTIMLDESWQDIHDAYQTEKWIKNTANMEKLAMRMKMKKIVKSGGEDDNKKSELESLKDSLSILKSLGVPIGGNLAAPAANSKNDLSFMTLMMESNKNMLQMQMENQKNMATMMMGMMQMFAGQNKNSGSEQMFKEVMGLVMNTVDLKNALTPERKSSLDKVIEMIGEMAPGIVSIYQQKGLEAARKSPLVDAAKNTKQFQDIKNNAVDLEYIVKTMDEKQGPEQTDIFLKTLGLTRPGGGGEVDNSQVMDIEDVEEESPDNSGEEDN